MPAAVVVALSAALAQAAEATLPAEASVSDGGGGERARGVWGKGGRALPAAVVGRRGTGAAADGVRLRRFTGTTQTSCAPPPKTRPRQIV